MPTVATGAFFTQGQQYLRGDPVPEEILQTIPPYIMEIHVSKGLLRTVSEEDAKVMRWEREQSEKDALEARRVKDIERTKEKIASLRADLDNARARESSAVAAITKLEAKLAELDPQPEPVLDAEPEAEEELEAAPEQELETDEKPRRRGRGRSRG